MSNPDYNNYHRSVTDELYSLKDRIRSLVGHWQTDGEWKETALRNVLRRHLPESVIVGRGFVVGPSSGSTQIDVLIVNASKPILFKDGDLMIVTPDAVIAAIEVKTKVDTEKKYVDAISKLTAVEKFCHNITGSNSVWTGLFVFEGGLDQQECILRACGSSYKETQRVIHCICSGKDAFIRHWRCGSEVNSVDRGPVWHSYELCDVAPSYFVGNLIDWISPIDNEKANFSWFPVLDGKETFRRFLLPVGDIEPIAFNQMP